MSLPKIGADFFGRNLYHAAECICDECRSADHLRSLIQANARQSAELARYQWQPIETAPKGCDLLVRGADGTKWVAWRDIFKWTVRTPLFALVRVELPQPTHWMPLPPEPLP